MRSKSMGFWLDFWRVFSRRISGNKKSLLLELVAQPLVVAALVFMAFLNHDDVDAYKLNFIYFSTLYAFWIGMFGSCQAINSEVRSGEWCYWVLGMGRNRTTHVLAIWMSCLLFAFMQCLVFFLFTVALAKICPVVGADGTGVTNHFIDMFVSAPCGKATAEPIYQMNGALWFVLTSYWGDLGPALFAMSIFALSLFLALVTGTFFGLLFGSLFKEPATSLNIAVGFVVLLGMLSLCGLRGDGKEKVDALFAPLYERGIVLATMNRENFASNAVPAAAISYILPQRYFFNVGRITFNRDWDRDGKVQAALRARFTNCVETSTSDSSRADTLRFRACWVCTNDPVACFDTTTKIVSWINNWSERNLDESDQKCLADDSQSSASRACVIVRFLRKHPEHRKGWEVSLHRKLLLTTIGLEMLPLLLINALCLCVTLLSVWLKDCYQQLR